MAAANPPPKPLLNLLSIPGRGRAFSASRDIKPGEILLSEPPLLLYPSPSSSSPSSFCSHCFRFLPSSPFPCPSCPSFLFCSPLCLSSSLCSSHSPPLCLTLRSLPDPLPDPHLRSQLLFLLAAYALSSTSPPNFHLLLSLDAGNASPAPQDAIFIHSLIGPLTGFSMEVIALLIGVDKRNAFGLMEPFGDGERRVRAYGIYQKASFFNHDCLPNACRFDYLDRDGEGNTDITVRAIHEIREGREVCLSYFPVNWGYDERQERLLEDYGFLCRCDRCEVEKNWKDEEDMEEDEIGEDLGDGDGDFPHAYFFVKYVCGEENCGGTLAPLPPSPRGTLSGLIECNVCGRLRKEEDGFGGDDDGGDAMMLVE